MSDKAHENAESKNRKAEAPAKATVQRETMGEVPALGVEPLGTLAQRAQLAPGTINPTDGKRLQGALGNQISAPTGAGNTGIGAIQAKLTVGAVNDTYEQEADRVADQVMQASSAPSVDAGGQAPATISRMPQSSAQRAAQPDEPGGAFAADAGLEADLQRSHGGGAPLSNDLRAQFEPSFGASFDSVRIHNGGDSARMSNAIQAKAFTHGSDIHFNQGEYDPNSSAGQRLLAHELTHVVQQGAATQAPVAQRKAMANGSFAVQRTPFGTIQRTNKKVSSLISFWEDQKKANAPKNMDKPGSGAPPAGGGAPGGGGGAVSEVFAPTPGALRGSVSGGGAPSGGGMANANSSLAAIMAQTPSGGGGGGGSVFDLPSGGGALNTPSGGGGGSGSGVLNTPNVVSHFSFSSSDYSSSADSSSGSWGMAGAKTPQAPRPKAVQFPGQTKYKDRLTVHSDYEDEMVDSTIFVMTKVFQVTSAADFFSRFTPEQRKLKLIKGIGWTETDVAELEATQKSKVKYVEDEGERAEYVLNLGPTITQGSAKVPYDTKDLFANGVGFGHAIFVMDPNGIFYAGRHKVGVFHHSSFLAGGVTASAGTLQIVDGKLKGITAKSGHYMPKPRQMRLALAELQGRGVSLAGVTIQTLDANTFKLDPVEDAQNFLDAGLTPELAQMSSSPQTMSSSSSGGFISGSTPIGGWFAGARSGTPGAQDSNFSMSRSYLIKQAGGYDWKDKLRAMGMTNQGKDWSYKSYMIQFDDLLKILRGDKTIKDFVSID